MDGKRQVYSEILNMMKELEIDDEYNERCSEEECRKNQAYNQAFEDLKALMASSLENVEVD